MAAMRNPLVLLGVPVDNLTMPEALERLDHFVAVGRATGKSHQIATVNADFVVNSLHDPELRRILQESDMATADGMPVVWGSRLLGSHVKERVTGADLVPTLAAHAAAQGYSLFLLGARTGIAAQAAKVLQDRHPTLKIAGVLSPLSSSVLEMDDAIVETVKAAKPDILLVAFGNPKQEKWISMHLPSLYIPVSIGIGGTLDMLVGATKRAPQWMQKSGLEWVYRLAQEPRRLWKRYVLDFGYFSYFFLHQWWQMRRGADTTVALALAPMPPTPPTPLIVPESTTVLHVRGRLDIANQAAFAAEASRALETKPFLVVDLAEATFLDSAALGTLITVANAARDGGGAMWLAAVPPAIQKTLKAIRLDRFFTLCDDIPAALVEQEAHPDAHLERAVNHAHWTVVTLPRLVDATTTAAILERCTERLETNARLVLDLAETTFLASAGMAAMIKLNRLAHEHGGELRIAGCSRDVMRSLELVKLDTILVIFATVDAAVAHESSMPTTPAGAGAPAPA